MKNPKTYLQDCNKPSPMQRQVQNGRGVPENSRQKIWCQQSEESTIGTQWL